MKPPIHINEVYPMKSSTQAAVLSSVICPWLLGKLAYFLLVQNSQSMRIHILMYIVLYRCLELQIVRIRSQCGGSLKSFEICQPDCPESCILCSDDSTCLLCRALHYRVVADNRCYPCPSDCVECIRDGFKWETSKVCNNQGYYLSSSELPTGCQVGCLTCQNIQSCSKCNQGYVLSPDSVCQGCLENCATCDEFGYCLACNSGFLLLLNGTCSPCSDHIKGCQECFFRSTTGRLFEQRERIYCSACTSPMILNPSLMNCVSCSDCTCAFIEDDQILFPQYPVVKALSIMACIKCPQLFYLLSGTCKPCDTKCTDGCTASGCLLCLDGNAQTDMGCIACQVLTSVMNCRRCQQRTATQQWRCVECFQGTQLTLQGLCVPCIDSYCDVYGRLRTLNDFSANEITQLTTANWVPCTMANRTLQMEAVEVDSIIFNTPIPGTINGKEYCQLCGLGCAQCRFNAFKRIGDCEQCSDGYVFVQSLCLPKSNQTILSYKLLINITDDMQDVESRLKDLSIYQQSVFLPIVMVVYSISITNESTISSQAVYELDREILYSEFELKGCDIVCNLSHNCLSIRGFSSILISEVSFLITTLETDISMFLISQEGKSQIVQVENVTITEKNYSLDAIGSIGLLQLESVSTLINLGNVTFLDVGIGCIVCNDLENVDTDGVEIIIQQLSFNRTSWLKGSLITWASLNPMISMQLILFSDSNFTDCQMISIQGSQFYQMVVDRLAFIGVTMDTTSLFKFDEVDSHQSATLLLFNVDVINSSLTKSPLLSNQDEWVTTQITNFTLQNTTINMGGSPLFGVAAVTFSRLTVLDCELTDMVLISWIIRGFNQGANIMMEFIVINGTFLDAPTLLFFIDNKPNSLESFQNLYISISNLLIYNLTMGQHTTISTRIAYEAYVLVINNCDSCIILIDMVGLHHSLPLVLGQLQSVNYLKLSQVQVEGGPDVENTRPGDCPDIYNVQQYSPFIRVSGKSITLEKISIFNLYVQQSLIRLTDFTDLTIQEVTLRCNRIMPRTGEQNPTMILIDTASSISLKLVNVEVSDNQLIFDPNSYLILKLISVVLEILGPKSDVQMTEMHILRNLQYVYEAINAAKQISFVIPICSTLTQSINISNSEFCGLPNPYDQSTINTFITELPQLDLNSLLYSLQQISATFLFFSQVATANITNCHFSTSIVGDTAAILFATTNAISQLVVDACTFRQMYCLAEGCAIHVVNQRGAIMLMSITDTLFADIIGIEKGLFDIAQTFQSLELSLSGTTFTNCISMAGAGIIDFWSVNGQQGQEQYLDNTEANINSSMQLFKIRLQIHDCKFTQDGKFFMKPTDKLTLQGQYTSAMLLRGQFIAVSISRCTFTNLFSYSNWLQFGQSYLAIRDTLIRDSVWANTLINIYYSQVFIRGLEIRNMYLCYNDDLCEQFTSALVKPKGTSGKGQGAAPMHEGRKVPNFDISQSLSKLLIVADVEYCMLKLIQYDIVISSTTITDIKCARCANGIISLYYASFLLRGLTIQQSAINGSLVIVFDDSQFGMVDNCMFWDNQAFSSVYIISGQVEIDNSRFLNNTAVYGQIYCETAQLNIKNSVFESNSADLSAGAIALDDKQQSLVVSNCSFNYNIGYISGAIVARSISPTISDSTFFGNQALASKHPDILSCPTKLSFWYKQRQLDLSKPFPEYVVSSLNNSLPAQLLVGLQSAQGETIIFSELEQDHASLVLLIRINGLQYQFDQHDLYTFIIDTLSIVSQPGKVAVVSVKSPLIGSGDVYNLTFHVRLCLLGEVYQSSDHVCIKCNDNTYSLLNNTCRDCPDSAMCFGGQEIFLKPGFWRLGFDSEIIVNCYNYPANCVGDLPKNGSRNSGLLTVELVNAARYCSKGLMGPLCETCDIEGEFWGERYTTSLRFKCSLCSDMILQFVGFTLIMLWTLFSLYLSVWSIISDVERDLQAYYLRKLGFIYGNINDISRQKSCLYKILLYHFQVFALVFTFRLGVPSLLDQSISAISNQLRHIGYSFDCFIAENFDIERIPLIYQKNLLAFIIPLALFAMFMIFFMLGMIMKRVRPRFYLTWTAFFFITLLFQPQILQIILQTMACREIGGVEYVQSDVSQLCYSTKHILFTLTILLPGLLFYEVLLPAIIMYLLIHNRQQLDKIRIKFSYGFIYYEYRPHAYYWELIKILKRMVLFFAISFVDTMAMTKGAIILAVLELYIIACSYTQPYVSVILTKIDLVSQFVNFSAILLTMIVVQSASIGLLVAYIVILSMANLAWLILVAKVVAINYFKRDMSNKLYVIQQTINGWRQRPSSSNSLVLKTQATLESCVAYISKFFGSRSEDRATKLWASIRWSFQHYTRQSCSLELRRSFINILQEHFKVQTSQDLFAPGITCHSLRFRGLSMEPIIHNGSPRSLQLGSNPNLPSTYVPNELHPDDNDEQHMVSRQVCRQ